MGLAHLIGLSSAVLVSTLVASFAPLYAPLSQSKLEAVSLLSSGILPGAALSVVIPEGVAALYRATAAVAAAAPSRAPGSHDVHTLLHGDDDDGGDAYGEANTKWIGSALLAGFLLMYLMDSVHGHDNYVDPTPHHHPHKHRGGRHRHQHAWRPSFNPTPSHLAELEPLANGASRPSNDGDDGEAQCYCSAPPRSGKTRSGGVASARECCSEGEDNDDDDDNDRLEAATGGLPARCDLEAAAGERRSGPGGGRPCGLGRGGGRGIPRWDSAATLRGSRPPSPVQQQGDHYDSAGAAATCPEGETGHHHHVMRADASSVSTVLGLVAHSIADGISLGASSLPANTAHPTATSAAPPAAGSSLQLVVFIAIMLHKAPTAFALASLLASSPANSRTFIRRALVLFSLAAPLGALATYAVLSLLGGGSGGDGHTDTEWYTGLALVFSGGTFLFVATHALREQEKREERKQRQAAAAAGGSGGGDMGDDPPPRYLGQKGRLALVLIGMLLPAVLTRLVGHGH
ncbi:hypothetical protein JCM3774_006641 [Rhodotorula dairenensis]